MSRVWRILVIDQSQYFDEALWKLILPAAEFELVGLTQTVDEALPDITALRPDLILVDISDGERGGLPTIRTLRQHTRRLPIIALSPLAAEVYEQAARRAGAAGCLSKAELVLQLPLTAQQVMSPWQPVKRWHHQLTTSIATAQALLNQELSQLPQHLIGISLGLVSGAVGVVMAILLALVVQVSLPPSVVFLPGLIPLMMIALLAGRGAIALFNQGARRISPHWFQGQREQMWRLASACATGTCLFQIILFTPR